MNRFFVFLFFFVFSFFLSAQTGALKRLTHDVYDSWKSLEKPIVSNNGEWIAYEINPFTGDGFMVLHNRLTRRNDTIHRAYDAAFTPSSKVIVFKIKAFEEDLKLARIARKKKDEMPRDSIGFINLENKRIFKYANFRDFKLPEKESSWMAFSLQNARSDSSGGTANTGRQSEAKPSNRPQRSTLHIADPVDGKNHTFSHVTDYVISSNGQWVAFASSTGNNNNVEVKIFNTRNGRTTTVFKADGTIRKLTSDANANQLAFLFSTDTGSVKNFGLYYFNSGIREARQVIDSSHALLTGKYRVSDEGDMFFSEDGRRLFWRYAPFTAQSSTESLPDEEKAVLDLWSWTDVRLQSQQLAELEKDLKKSYLAVFITANERAALLAREDMPEVILTEKRNAPLGLGVSELPYQLESSWGPSYKDYYTLNLNTGSRRKILERQEFTATLSPAAKYVLYYNGNDSAWYAYNIESRSSLCLTKDLDAVFYDCEFDKPGNPPPFGIAAWTEDDRRVLIYAKFNIWLMDPSGNAAPVNLTKNIIGENTVHRYVKLHKDEDFLAPNARMLVKYVNRNNMDEGFYTLHLGTGAVDLLISSAHRYTSVVKAKDASVLLFRRSSYREFPDLWLTNLSFRNPLKLSDANPQQKEYLWGNVELISWTFNEKTHKGLLYKPDNFDASQKYPMITYFYERTSQTLHNYYNPNPGRSVINFPLYTGNGYLIFVPDIEYDIGRPGESALNITLSGIYELLGRGFVDQNKLGLHGQSWGGYQTAYIITRTNLFKAAMAGAPVANMTSAYGAIRRKTGINRIHQYEIGQSRIGATLWERRDLYIENSPVFFADRIETPLLMMSNDNDGAVPWEQGIEMFLALRRLQKPVWLLNYNKDEHNLTKKANRIDLSIRMMQFFDHYLKDAPMPSWMRYGISATEKGINNGYNLITE